MSKTIIGIAVAIFIGVILIQAIQTTLTSTSTTGWSALTVTIVFLLPTITALTILILAFRAVAGRS